VDKEVNCLALTIPQVCEAAIVESVHEVESLVESFPDLHDLSAGAGMPAYITINYMEVALLISFHTWSHKPGTYRSWRRSLRISRKPLSAGCQLLHGLRNCGLWTIKEGVGESACTFP
jgi:hypothetical protein